MHKRHNERTALQVRLKELEDQRRDFDGSINKMESNLNGYREHLLNEQKKDAAQKIEDLK